VKTFLEAFPKAIEVQPKPLTQSARDKEFVDFVIERQAIYRRKEIEKLPKPWDSTGPRTVTATKTCAQYSKS
jgi:hypothetical protein